MFKKTIGILPDGTSFYQSDSRAFCSEKGALYNSGIEPDILLNDSFSNDGDIILDEALKFLN